MSIPVLIQTYDEIRRLAIAGSVVAPGDFRLKKLVPLLEQAGRKAPVFAKVGEAARRLTDSDEKSSAAALLELTTLVNAILYTQGHTGIEGEIVPIKTIDVGRPRTQASSRVLKPLQVALTRTGSGRFEIIRDAHAQGAFHDLRLVAPALAALDDGYKDIGDFVAQDILPLYGPAILPELQAAFDPKGGAGQARRLLLIHRLDPVGVRPYVQRSLDEGSKEVRIAAIGCLGDSPDDLSFLLEQAKAKAKDVRTAAFRALGNSGADEAAKVLCDAIGNADFSLAVEPLRTSRNPIVTDFLLEAAERQFDALIEIKESDKHKLGKQNERMCLFLECQRGRDDKKSEKLLLKMFAHVGRLAAIQGEPSGKDVVERLVAVMATGPADVQSALIDAHETLPAECLGDAFLAALHCRKPAEVFRLFSPYLTAEADQKRKNRNPAYTKRDAIMRELSQERRRHAGPDEHGRNESERTAELDPQWLDLSVKLGLSELVPALAVPGHAQANALLAELFDKGLGKPGEAHEILGTMIRVGHPDATDATIKLIRQAAKGRPAYYSYSWIGDLIKRLPKAEALCKLEALLPTLPEELIDDLMDSVTQLKSSP